MHVMAHRPTFDDILNARFSRRTVLASAAASVGLAACARLPTKPGTRMAAGAFKSVTPQNSDQLVLADGYRQNIVARWGDSLVTGTPDFDTRRLMADDWLNADAVAAQERQFGTNADAVGYFPQVRGRAARGLVCVNHEYVSGEMIWPGHTGVNMKAEPGKAWLDLHPNAIAFMQAAHGVTVMQLQRDEKGWTRDITSPFNRRITANTPMEISGPARGHALMRTNADPSGTRVLGTFANCAAGKTPWGTYLTSEENVDDYFAGAAANRDTRSPEMTDAYRRFPLRDFGFYHWNVQDPRFDTAAEPHEPFRFGWMVEIDPNDPRSVPRKRTALGRMQHEGANTIVGKSGHVAAYMGDDEKFEYIYKFVTRDTFDAKNPAANRDLLDNGTLYCARFDADGTGEWMPLVQDENGPLNSAAGFANQGDVVIKVRAAADLLGATPMDRPEDVEPSPVTGRIYIPCTKTAERGGTGDTNWFGRRVDIGTNAANPRPENRYGHIIEIAENGDDVRARKFTWSVFLLAGDPSTGSYIVDAQELAKRFVEKNLAGTDTYFAGYPNPAELSPIQCPDNLGIDPQGRLWIVTDSDNRGHPNNGCFVVPTDGPQRGLLKQLASGPNGCEVCGCEFTPDGRTLFLSIQHPGEGGTLAKPTSHWPDGNGQPARAALVAIEREDGGAI
jgi:secreted PhoX family phosphatase